MQHTKEHQKAEMSSWPQPYLGTTSVCTGTEVMLKAVRLHEHSVTFPARKTFMHIIPSAPLVMKKTLSYVSAPFPIVHCTHDTEIMYSRVQCHFFLKIALCLH